MTTATLMSPRDREALIEIVMAATQAVVPHVTDAERSMLGAVIDGMLREREAPLNCD